MTMALASSLSAGAVLFLLAGGVTSQGPPDTSKLSSKLNVHIPHSLAQDGGYDHREALFGMPPYGGKIVQNVIYADSDLCDPGATSSGGYPQQVDEKGKAKAWEPPFILMVDRGHCTFVQKVRNAQHLGAAGVLIADNTCLCSDKTCMTANPGTTCEMTEPIMADDGSGADIAVPSFLLFKTDGDVIINELKQNRPVQVEMAWSLPNPDDRVEYELWTSPADSIGRPFLESWKEVAKSLNEHAYFTPHMYLHDGTKSGCHSSTGDNYCYTLCTNSGRYCATDPDDDLSKGISGADVVKESLRRICIWGQYGAPNGVGEQWWDYVMEFNTRCGEPQFFKDEACIKDAYKHSKVDGAKVEACMRDSGGTDGDNTNSKLDTELTAQSRQGVVVIPTAYVNSAVIRGSMKPSTVFHAICAGFADGTAPKICDKCSTCGDPSLCVTKGKCVSGPSGSSDGSVSKHTFASSMFFVIALFGGLGVWHYKRTREEMRDQVRGILSEYMPLEDNENGGGMMMSGVGVSNGNGVGMMGAMSGSNMMGMGGMGSSMGSSMGFSQPTTDPNSQNMSLIS